MTDLLNQLARAKAVFQQRTLATMVSTQVTPNFKAGKRVDDARYRAYVRQEPCVICQREGLTQNSQTEFHHTICGRHSQAKTSCCDGIPLCHSHHHKMRPYAGDENKFGIHNNKAAWVETYGNDTDYIEQTRETIKRLYEYEPKEI